MKICFVSGFPPSKAVLNEYGFHVARELQADPLISLIILADDYSGTGTAGIRRASLLEGKPPQQSRKIAEGHPRL
jgi:hypothetical protein